MLTIFLLLLASSLYHDFERRARDKATPDILFNHGPPVGSHSAGLAGVVRYFLLFFACVYFFRVVVLSFVSFLKTKEVDKGV